VDFEAPFTNSIEFDVRTAGHLLRRLEFGATPDKLDEALESGPQATVERIFDFDPHSDVGGLDSFLEQAKSLFDVRRNVNTVADWWLHRMTHTPKPLQERMALLWHDHFATSAGKVRRADWMHDQIEAFRRDGLGSFRDLVVKVGRQPAMLRWLDGDKSKKGSPNENYGREVLELFCLGVGHYEEADIQELSRAFTGWQIRGSSSRFDEKAHDADEKTIFAGTEYATTGTLNDEQAVDAILKHPEAARFIARRLLQTFVHPKPLDEHVDHYAGRLRSNDWHVGDTLREIVGSRLMMSEWAYRSRIKSPVELVVGSCFATGGRPRASFLRGAVERMGQKLLYPPNVAGWEGGRAWINSTTVIERFRFCRDLGQQGFNEFAGNGLREFVDGRELDTAEDVADAYATVMLDGRVSPNVRERLVDYLSRNRENEPATWKRDGRRIREKVGGIIQLIASCPAYQLA
jgi:uncharacterized protein (DUF1800 family)